MEEFIQQNIWWLGPAIVWTMAWTGVALWRAARLNDLSWFLALFLINSLGLLEILYIYIFSKRKNQTQAPQE